MNNRPTALIAEDEPLLAAHLQSELARQWPELEMVATVGNGTAAIEQCLALRPDIVWLDIRMPGATGLEAAQAIAEDWPDVHPLPMIVFVTAYDQHALEAFERAAVDYVLKPVSADRLALTCGRLKAALASRAAAISSSPGSDHGARLASFDATLDQLRRLVSTPPAYYADPAAAIAEKPARITTIQAAIGTAVHMVPVAEVIYFEAADKYVRVVTADREYLIRTSLRDLLPQLDPSVFWQIHRGTVVRADAVSTAVRDESGKVHLTLRGRADQLVASRLYASLFKAM